MESLVIDMAAGRRTVTCRDLPVPATGPRDILVRVAAVAVNPVDLQVRSGEVPGPLPSVVGWDASGVVEHAGSHVTRFSVGDHVVAMSAQAATGVGTAAEYVALDEGLAGRAPTSVGLTAAAALPLGALTAHQALAGLGTPAGRDLLIVGAAGSVGGYAVQLARHDGWRVIAVGRPSDAEAIANLGADEALISVEDIPANHFDAVLDTAGVPAAIAAVHTGGRFVTVTPRRVPTPERAIRPEVVGVQQNGTELARLAELVDDGVLQLRIGRVLPFAKVDEGYATLARGGLRGKVLLTPTARTAGKQT